MKRFWLPVLLGSLCAAGCTSGTKVDPGNNITLGSKENLQGMQLAGIRTVTVQSSTLSPSVELTGQVNPTEMGQAVITAPLTGVIDNPLVRAGDRVAEGQPVAIVNSVYGQTSLQLSQKLEADESALVTARGALVGARSALAQAQTTLGQARSATGQARDNLTQARAELINSRTDLRRKILLQKGGVFAVSDVDDARERYAKALSTYKDMKYALRVAKGGVDLAANNVHLLRANLPLTQESVALSQVNLDRDRSVYNQSSLSGANLPQNLTPVPLQGGRRLSAAAAAASTSFYIRSPIAGIVTNVTMTAGLAVSPGTALATVVNTRTVYVDANAFESDLRSIHVGDKLVVTTEASPQTKFPGRVTSIGKQVDPTARTIPVRSLIENRSGLLRPSMFVTVRLAAESRRATLTVPETAVLIHGDRRYVYVETSPGHFEKRSVTLGLISNGQAEVVTGVKAGEKVVTEGNLVLEGAS